MNERAVSRGDCRTWAIVLAGGEGRRLHGLTTTAAGTVIPKQYCSLRGGASLLEEALRRAAEVAPRERICAVVGAEAGQWWRRQLRSLPPENIVVQPLNRGTANGVLLPLLHILERDPQAQVVLLPSDHYVHNEPALARALRRAAVRARAEPHKVLLLGIEPEAPDPDLGYILPGTGDGADGFEVARFVEKPPAALAHEFIAAGALWNAFIIVAHARALLTLFEARCRPVVTQLRQALREEGAKRVSLASCYLGLEARDFSRHILEGQESALRVLRVPSCGWSDLGTPLRIEEVLRRYPATASEPSVDGGGWLNLAAQHQRTTAAPGLLGGSRVPYGRIMSGAGMHP
ncbi:MAG TPA: sugar phosphate nucleotidyltransferase [Steroidobacteraceae bacterium]|nr:sugar phosphate nucleotidyltransferase [Steroidobacteraceae bacterium]